MSDEESTLKELRTGAEESHRYTAEESEAKIVDEVR